MISIAMAVSSLGLAMQCVAVSDVVINEFMAVNTATLKDTNGLYSDWIELCNMSTSTVSLTGWYLTDNEANLTKWRFPSGSIAAGGYLVVFASDSTNPVINGEYHTNFKLGDGGEYLALVWSNGATIKNDYAPQYPNQQANVSYGLSVQTSVVFGSMADCRVLVPSNSAYESTWFQRLFDDSSWTNGLTGVGYEYGAGYEAYLGTVISNEMFGVSESACIRIPFNLSADSKDVQRLRLKMKFDDGFVAYVNGVEAARSNAPATVHWNSAASALRADADALVNQLFTIPVTNGMVGSGSNILAIQGMEYLPHDADPDFLILPELDVETAVQTYLETPTPGAANSSARDVIAVEAIPGRGYYSNTVTVTVTSDTSAVDIRYTLDGTDPGTGSVQYVSPLTFTNTTTLRARAYKTGYIPAESVAYTYLFLDGVVRQPTNPPGYPLTWNGDPADYAMEEDPVDVTIVAGNTNYTPDEARAVIRESLRAFPSLSIVLGKNDLFDPATGIYANPTQRGDNWEKAASIEMILPDGSSAFQANGGLQMMGYTSRTPSETPKHSMRIVFKSRYGPSRLDYPFFPDSRVKKANSIALRTNVRDSWLSRAVLDRREMASYIRNKWAEQTMKDMGRFAMESRQVHVYLNGIYWGVYEASERPDAELAAACMGGDDSEYDVIKFCYPTEAVDGDLGRWTELKAHADAGLAANADYQHIQGNNADGSRNTLYAVLCNVDEMIDFLVEGQYCASYDWPANWYGMRHRGEQSTGYQFLAWDDDMAFYNDDVNFDKTTIINNGWFNDSPGCVDRGCRLNAEYRIQFADHVQKHYFNGGMLTTNECVQRWLELADAVRPGMIAESARWGDYRRDVQQYQYGPYLLYTVWDHWDWFRSYMATNYLPFRGNAVLNQLRSKGLYPNVFAPVFLVNGTNQHGGLFSAGASLTIFASNSVYYTLDGADPREYGTGNATGTLYSGAIPLTEPRLIKARALDVGGGNVWSALAEAYFVPDELSPLRITEVMYHPADPPPAETNWIDEDFEFIELRNTGPTAIRLDGLRFTQGVDFEFIKGSVRTLDAGEYMLVVRNAAAFSNRYTNASSLKIAGAYQPVWEFPLAALSDGGEEIRIKDGAGRTVSRFSYNDARGWPLSADGAGHSLVSLVTVSQTNDVLDCGLNWRASAYIGGSPGYADPEPARDVVINEVVAHTDYTNGTPPLNEYDSNDWIELFNIATTNIGLGRWYLSDDGDNLMKWAIPATNIIAGRGFVTFDEISGFHSPITNGFGLNKNGDAVYLSCLPVSGSMRVADCVEFKGQENEMSEGRYPDGAGGGSNNWYALSRTRNTTNAMAADHVVISEVMYNPAETGALESAVCEYVELYNPCTTQVHMWTTAGPWRMNGGIEYDFPTNTAIEGRSYIVLVGFDPSNTATLAMFNLKYGLTNGQVRIMGPYDGRLSNEGDRIALERPQDADWPETAISWVIVDEVIYFDQLPWLASADGTGRSLRRKSTTQHGNDPANWLVDLFPTPGQKPVKVAIGSPEHGTTYVVPFSTEVTAVIDPDHVVGSVSNVEFFEGTNSIGVDTTYPYTATLSGLTNPGPHTLSARMVDGAGTNESPPIAIGVLGIDNGAGASDATDEAAVLNGELKGYGSALVYIYWGSSDGGTNVSGWAHQETLGAVGVGAFHKLVTGMLVGRFYYRCRAVVAGGEAWAPVSTESYLPLDNWTGRMKITPRGYDAAGSLTNIPLVLKLGEHLSGFRYSDFGSPHGYDLRFTDMNGTGLEYELEQWNTGGTSYVWVKIPLLNSSNDWIRAYWGNNGETNALSFMQDGSVWTEGYGLVQHMSMTGGVSVYDSSAAHRRSGVMGAGSWVTAGGQLGGGLDFIGGSGDGIVLTNADTVAVGEEWTITAWYKQLASEGARRTFASLDAGNSHLIVNRGTSTVGVVSGSKLYWSDARFYTNSLDWKQVVVVGSGTVTEIYVDGVHVGMSTGKQSGAVAYIGNTSTGQKWSKYLDEVTIATRIRSGGWIRTTWLNQASNESFMSYQWESTASPVDDDTDGLADDWEQTYFLGTNVTDGSIDSDDDTFTDGQEYTAGTDPTNKQDRLEVEITLQGTVPVVKYPTVEAQGPAYTNRTRYYNLEDATNLPVGGWANVSGQMNIRGDGTVKQYSNAPAGPNRFYRLKALLR